MNKKQIVVVISLFAFGFVGRRIVVDPIPIRLGGFVHLTEFESGVLLLKYTVPSGKTARIENLSLDLLTQKSLWGACEIWAVMYDASLPVVSITSSIPPGYAIPAYAYVFTDKYGMGHKASSNPFEMQTGDKIEIRANHFAVTPGFECAYTWNLQGWEN